MELGLFEIATPEANCGCQANDTPSCASQRCALVRRATRKLGSGGVGVAANGPPPSEYRHLSPGSGSPSGWKRATAGRPPDCGRWGAKVAENPKLRGTRWPHLQHLS